MTGLPAARTPMVARAFPRLLSLVTSIVGVLATASCSLLVPQDLTGGGERVAADGGVDGVASLGDATVGDAIVPHDATDAALLFAWRFDVGCDGWVPESAALSFAPQGGPNGQGACRVCPKGSGFFAVKQGVPAGMATPQSLSFVATLRSAAPGDAPLDVEATIYESAGDLSSELVTLGAPYVDVVTRKVAGPGATFYLKSIAANVTDCFLLAGARLERW